MPEFNIKNQQLIIALLILILTVTSLATGISYIKDELKHAITTETLTTLEIIIDTNESLSYSNEDARKTAIRIRKEFAQMKRDIEALKQHHVTP